MTPESFRKLKEGDIVITIPNRGGGYIEAGPLTILEKRGSMSGFYAHGKKSTYKLDGIYELCTPEYYELLNKKSISSRIKELKEA